MFKHMGMPFLDRQANSLCNRLENAKELCSVEPAALLTREQIVGAVGPAFTEPYSQRVHLVEKRLAPVCVKRLYRLQRSLQAPNRDRASFQIDVG